MSDEGSILAERCSAALHALDYCAQAMGMSIDEVGPGHAVLRMCVRKDMLNGHATAHGGMLFSLADTAFAHACNSHNRRTMASAASIEFVHPAVEGDVLLATATCVQQGRRSGVYDISVCRDDGTTIALFRGRSLSTDQSVLEE